MCICPSNWVQTNQLSRLTSEIAPAALACPGDHSYETMNPEGHEGPRMPAVFQIAVSAFPEECPKLFQKRLFAPNSASHPMSPCEGVSVEQLNWVASSCNRCRSSEEYPFVHVCSFTGFSASPCTTKWQHWNIPRLHWNALKLSVKLSWAFASFAFVAFSGRGSRGFASNLVIPSQNTSLAHVTYWHKQIMCSSNFSHVISVLPFDITIRGQLTSDFVDKSVWHSFSSGWTALVRTIYRTPLVK